MTVSVHIDEFACAAHGDCADLAPHVFTLDDTAAVTGTAPYETLLAAAKACPSVAITLVDDDTGEQLYP